LSGSAPFTGKDDSETGENIKKCNLRFPPESFAAISDNGKDFIGRLLVYGKGARMSVFEALDHAWLRDESAYNDRIPNTRYDNFKLNLKSRYAKYPDTPLALGRSANFGALRKLKPKEYGLYSSFFDRRDAAPRFGRRPRDQHVIEGQSAEFKCLILAASPAIVSWFRDHLEIKQSIKHIKKYSNFRYALEIKRCGQNDKGEYIVKASNSFGERECPVFLTVEREYSIRSECKKREKESES
jgi:serine/threonine protein kinase